MNNTIQLINKGVVGNTLWPQYLDAVPGNFKTGLSQIRLARKDLTNDIVGTFAVDVRDESKAVVNWDTDTLPADTIITSDLQEKSKIDYPDLLKEGENVTIIINTEDNNPLSVDMPLNVTLEVTHTEPGVKGNTATNATKPATLETGAVVNVPLFINEGDKVKIDTEKGQYLERIK